jgi:xanthine dehydrogenase accessory factor
MQIFKDLCRVLRDDRVAVLATIITTSGSTPAPRQSRMIVRFTDPITSIGTIGGGCLDAEILWKAEHERLNTPRFFIYSLDDPIGDTGLICGGKVEVMLECIDSSMRAVYEGVVAEEAAGHDCVLVTEIDRDRRTKKFLLRKDAQVLVGDAIATGIPATIRAALMRLRSDAPIERVREGAHEYVIELLEARPPLIIFGAGHVGKVVSQCAALAGFKVTVVDDRKTFANKERFPEAERVLCEGFAESFSRLNITPATFIVIVTRGHRHDELVLENVLQHDVRYVGMIGSRGKIRRTFSRLYEKGIPMDVLEKVHAPIGVAIGARTAEEIGIGIVAELIAVRRQGTQGQPREVGNEPHLQTG